MNKKILLTLTLTLLLVLLSFSACGYMASSESSSAARTSSAASESSVNVIPESNTLLTKVNKPELFPVAEGAKLTVWCGQDGNVTEYATNPENAELQALTGVEIEWITAPGTQADMNVMFNLNIASGIYPDIYLNSFSTSDVMTYANDVFIPLNEYIENTTWIKQYIADLPAISEAITAPDGNIYCLWKGLPTNREDSSYDYPFKLFIYQPWLDKASMKVPTTIDEYREVLRYFRDNDMNGNGDTDDELPMLGSFAFDHDGSDPTYNIMNAFQTMTPDFLWFNEDQTINCIAITDKYREGLRYLNSMFEEGLIPEDIYALTLNEFRDVVNVPTAEQMIVGSAGGPDYGRVCNVGIFGDRAYDEWTIVTGLKKDENTPAQKWARNSAPGLYGAVTTACKDPQLAIDWIDACIDPEISLSTNRGIEGTDWSRHTEVGEFPVKIETPNGTDLKRGGSQNNICFGGWVFPSIPSTYYEDVLVEGTTSWKYTTNLRAANANYEEIAVYDSRPLIAWCGDMAIIDELATLSSPIDDAITTAYAEFILGRKDIEDDAVWEAYKQNLSDLKLERFLELTQICYYGA